MSADKKENMEVTEENKEGTASAAVPAEDAASAAPAPAEDMAAAGEEAAAGKETRCGGQPDDETGRGLVHIYCGDGKGKTTCSVGLTVRAVGSGKKVLFHQFLKDNSSSERNILDYLPGLTVVPGKPMEKFTFQMNAQELAELKDDNDAMLDGLFAMAKDFDMLVMDEAVYSIDLDLLSEDKLIKHLEEKPFGLEVVMAGRNPSERLQEHADYVSEIKKVKHPFDRGISSRLGIEM